MTTIHMEMDHGIVTAITNQVQYMCLTATFVPMRAAILCHTLVIMTEQGCNKLLGWREYVLLG